MKTLYEKLKDYWYNCGRNMSVLVNFITDILPNEDYESLEGITSEDKALKFLERIENKDNCVFNVEKLLSLQDYSKSLDQAINNLVMEGSSTVVFKSDKNGNIKTEVL